MTDYCRWVDPFLGNDEIDLPTPTFPANTWHFIKGLTGNTNPASCLPFGKYSCCGYSSAYPTGHGLNAVNSGEPIRHIFDSPRFIGLAHFQQSGTGAIRYYYNYALTSPFTGTVPDFKPLPLLNEEAEPGYYAAHTELSDCETTVSGKAVLHRWKFAKSGTKLAVDFANDGLYCEQLRHKASGTVRITGENEVLAEMRLSDVTLWFDFICIGASAESLFCADTVSQTDSLTLSAPSDVRFGAIFVPASDSVEVRLAVSARSAEHAQALNREETRSFEEIRAEAHEIWNVALSRVEIDTDDDRERQIFYSNLYHTLIKPCDWWGEAFQYKSPDGDFVIDLATMWDIYKTQLPFLFTLYPEISRKLLSSLERFANEYGRFPHCQILSGNLTIESVQARLLAEYSICDAYYRGIPADYDRLLTLSMADAARFTDYQDGKCEFASHTLDMAEAYNSIAKLARRLGRDSDAEYLASQGKRFVEAFDADGCMRADSKYYEGNRYNYSFRVLHDMDARLAIAGRDAAEREVLRFFGYTDPNDFSSRFEGYNNETDMEAPAFLHAVGHRDKMCEVIRSGMDSMFTTGRGGIPGNADSGGLTACYLWNVLGLFPISGQNLMILGTPRFSRAVLHMPGGDLTILRHGDAVVPTRAVLNGRELSDFTCAASDLNGGGELVFDY